MASTFQSPSLKPRGGILSPQAPQPTTPFKPVTNTAQPAVPTPETQPGPPTGGAEPNPNAIQYGREKGQQFTDQQVQYGGKSFFLTPQQQGYYQKALQNQQGGYANRMEGDQTNNPGAFRAYYGQAMREGLSPEQAIKRANARIMAPGAVDLKGRPVADGVQQLLAGWAPGGAYNVFGGPGSLFSGATLSGLRQRAQAAAPGPGAGMLAHASMPGSAPQVAQGTPGYQAPGGPAPVGPVSGGPLTPGGDTPGSRIKKLGAMSKEDLKRAGVTRQQLRSMSKEDRRALRSKPRKAQGGPEGNY